jgi:radical SAM superfamily enzyme
VSIVYKCAVYIQTPDCMHHTVLQILCDVENKFLKYCSFSYKYCNVNSNETSTLYRDHRRRCLKKCAKKAYPVFLRAASHTVFTVGSGG